MAEFKNLVELCERSVKEFAGRELFGTKKNGTWTWLTYGDFGRMVAEARAGLASLGVGAGDKVAIISNNRVEWAVTCYATYGLGAAFVPMYEAQLPKEWKFILDDCGAKVVLGATNPIVEKLRALQPELPNLQHVIGFELPDADPASLTALRVVGARNPVAPVFPAWGDTAGFIYTSGTTGNPKGVILSHGNFSSNINAVHQIFPFRADDRSLAFLPWAHSFGQTCELHAFLSLGAAMAINDDVANLVANLAEVKPTVLLAVPRIFNRIYDGVNKQMTDKPPIIQKLFHAGIRAATAKSRGQSVGFFDGIALKLAQKLIFAKVVLKFGGRLQYVFSGSAALSKEVAEFIDALGITVYEGYGLTETSPIATANCPSGRKIGSVGRAIPGCTIQIDKAITGDPKHGEILIYGPNVMQGYYNREEENNAVMMKDGGFRSGDMGFVDEDGFLFITGRIKEQYKLENGKYVVPAPLEEEIKLSPYIVNVMIFGSNKPYNVALVVPDPDALKAWAQKNGKPLGDAATNPEVRALIQKELEERSTGFKGYEKIADFVITTEDFTTQNDMLTQTLKLKRRNVMTKYGEALEGLYKVKRNVAN